MNEFTHYTGCRNKDPDNCSACALLNSGEEGPNYAGWPLAFIQAGLSIPYKYRKALAKELSREDNQAYVDNLKTKLDAIGFQWKGLLK
jgi:hypothetical protein